MITPARGCRQCLKQKVELDRARNGLAWEARRDEPRPWCISKCRARIESTEITWAQHWIGSHQ